MKKMVEKSVNNLSGALAVRGYWYQGKIQIGKKESITIDNYMVDGYDHDQYFRIEYKKEKGVFSKEIKRVEFMDDLACEADRVGGSRNREKGIEHMYAVLECFDLETMQLDREKVKEVNQQFINESNKTSAQQETRTNQKVATAEMNDKEENEL